MGHYVKCDDIPSLFKPTTVGRSIKIVHGIPDDSQLIDLVIQDGYDGKECMFVFESEEFDVFEYGAKSLPGISVRYSYYTIKE
ncbi:MAG: hypothetical protein WC055_00285 [Melioribacteraceae bacterium]